MWISTDDSLPEYNKEIIYKILQKMDVGMYAEIPIIVIGKLILEEDGPVWIVGSEYLMWDYDYNLGFSMDDVIEWQPLPEPPEEE